MPKTRTPHPADAANAAILAQAARFDVALFLGTGRYARASAPTLIEAEAEATRLANEHPTAAKPLIYGVTAEGRSALVTNAIPRGRSAAHYSSRFNASRGARAALGRGATEDGDFAVCQEPAGWIWTPIAKNDTFIPPKQETCSTVLPDSPASASTTGRRIESSVAAQAGQLPPPPDFSAPTHSRFREKLARLVALAEAGDVECLKHIAINPVSTSPKAMLRYRDLAVTALEARRASGL